MFNVGNLTNYEEQGLISDKRKTAKLITSNTNENAKKLHKKSNSMKNDLLQKYYGKHNSMDVGGPSNHGGVLVETVINKNQSG